MGASVASVGAMNKAFIGKIIRKIFIDDASNHRCDCVTESTQSKNVMRYWHRKGMLVLRAVAQTVRGVTGG